MSPSELGFNYNKSSLKSKTTRTERTPGMVAVSGNCHVPGRSSGSFPGAGILNSNFPGQIPGAQGTESPSPYYLDYLAKVVQVDDVPQHCSPGYFIRGSDENGHRFAKEILCGREWCPVCGEDDSKAHMRRVARWLPKVQQLSSMGYFVFTLPEHERHLYRNKKALGILTKKLTCGDKSKRIDGILKRYGFIRGLSRWHWFGDESDKFNPHLNVIVEAGYLPQEVIDEIKTAWAGILGVDMVDVHYSYTDEPGKMMHILKYVTRATFHVLQWDEYLAGHIFNFRNMRSWGEWKKESVWDVRGKEQLTAIAVLEAGNCPICGKPISWAGKALPIGYLMSWGASGAAQELGAGYWLLPEDDYG